MSKRPVPPEPPAQTEGSSRPYTLGVAPAAAKAIEKLPNSLRERVEARIAELARAPRGHGVQKLADGGGEHRVRVGDVRVLFTIDDTDHRVRVRYVGPRDQAYR